MLNLTRHNVAQARYKCIVHLYTHSELALRVVVVLRVWSLGVTSAQESIGDTEPLTQRLGGTDSSIH